MAQPSEWATNLLKTKKQAERINDINVELNLRGEQMLQSKAPELWIAILEKIKADCELFHYQTSDMPLGETMGKPAVRLHANGATIRIVTALFDLNGHRVKVVRSHIRNGVEVPDSKEFIEIKLLMDSDEIVFLVDDAELYTIEQVSNRIMESLLTQYRT